MEQVVTQPEFDKDRPYSQQTLQQLKNHLHQLQEFEEWQASWLDLQAASLLLLEEIDEELLQEAQTIIARINRHLEQWEVQQLLIGWCDKKGAFLTIKAKDIDAEYWAGMLAQIYARWAQHKGLTVRLIDETCSEDAWGFSEVTLEIAGSFAYGYLKSETGRQRLKYNSPFDGGKLLFCSAMVEVIPLLDEGTQIDIPEKDLEIITYTKYGNVNGLNITVQIVHIPSGIAARSINERTQQQNKQKAFTLLRSKLFTIAQAQGVKEISKIRPHLISNDVWKAPSIRDYLCVKTCDYLCIEGKVKDHRTGIETTAIADVMNGNLDQFIYAYLLQKARTANE